MKPKILKEICIGCRICPALCPEVFFMDSENKAEVKDGADYEKYKEKIRESLESCPVKAIVDTEEEGINKA